MNTNPDRVTLTLFYVGSFVVYYLVTPRSRFACMLLTSLLFAAMHTQYVHWETLVALTLFSLLLCYARLLSNSLATLNNLIALLPAWFFS